MENEFLSAMSLTPKALLDKEKTLLALKQSRLTEYEKPFISLFEKKYLKYEELYQQLEEHESTLQEEIKSLNNEVEHVKKEVYEMDLEQNLIKNKIMTLKQNLPQTKKELSDENELAKLMEMVCSLKDGIGKKKSFLKNELEKFKRGILAFQKYLHCKVMFDSKDALIITLETSAKSVSDVREFLKFSVCDHGKTFQFVEMRPKLKSEQQLVKTYNETGDIQGFIFTFWNTTRRLNPRKVLCEKN